MDKKLIMLALQQSKVEPVILPLELEAKVNKRSVSSFFEDLETNGIYLQPTIDGNFHITREQRARLAIIGFLAGIDFDRIIKELTWQEFEILSTIIGGEFGYEAFTGLNFTTPARKYQIDVILKKNPYILLIDCKHFGGTGKKSALKKAVEEQIERAKALAKKVTDLQEKLKIASWKKIIFMPLIITWLDDEIYFYEKVPVVPFTKLRSFFDDFYIYFKDILQLEISK